MHTDDCPRRLPRASSPGRAHTGSGISTPRGQSPLRARTGDSSSRTRNNSPSRPSNPSQLPASNVTASDLRVIPDPFGQLTQIGLHADMRNHANRTGLTGFTMASTVIMTTVPGNRRGPGQVSRSPVLMTTSSSSNAREGVQFTRTRILPEPASGNNPQLRPITEENDNDGELRSSRQ